MPKSTKVDLGAASGMDGSTPHSLVTRPSWGMPNACASPRRASVSAWAGSRRPPMRRHRTVLAGVTSAVAALSIGVLSWLAAGQAAPGFKPGFADNSANAMPVDTELVLAVDVSYSMDPDEQALQREGYVQAITSREFLQAVHEGSHGRIAITYFEWANAADQ